MGTAVQKDVPRETSPRSTGGAGDHAEITVVLAGDPTSLRSDVRAGLELHRFAVLAEADDADGAVEAALRHRPQVCLLDVDTPGGGIAAAIRINSSLPGTKIAMLSGSTTRKELRDAVLAGADAYVPRSTAPDRLAEALNALVNGEAAVPRALTVDLLREFRLRARPSHFEALISSQAASVAVEGAARAEAAAPLRRRVRSGMLLADAWSSARQRMRDYE